jgi:hypothetical protein
VFLYFESNPHIYDKEQCRKFLFKCREILMKNLDLVEESKPAIFDKDTINKELGIVIMNIEKLDGPDSDNGGAYVFKDPSPSYL